MLRSEKKPLEEIKKKKIVRKRDAAGKKKEYRKEKKGDSKGKKKGEKA